MFGHPQANENPTASSISGYVSRPACESWRDVSPPAVLGAEVSCPTAPIAQAATNTVTRTHVSIFTGNPLLVLSFRANLRACPVAHKVKGSFGHAYRQSLNTRLSISGRDLEGRLNSGLSFRHPRWLELYTNRLRFRSNERLLGEPGHTSNRTAKPFPTDERSGAGHRIQHTYADLEY